MSERVKKQVCMKNCSQKLFHENHSQLKRVEAFFSFKYQ
jgi:hypothetical protein